MLRLAFLFFCGVFADLTFYYKGNVSVSNGDLHYRRTTFEEVNVAGLYSAIWVSSVAVQAQQGSAQADGIFGAAYVAPATPLTAYLAYYEAAADWTPGSSSPATASLNGAGSLIGASYYALLEIDENNNTLQRIAIASLSWNITDVSTSGDLKYATFTGTDSTNANFQVSITFVASSVVGLLNNGATLTPKSVEASINILNFPFTSTTSSLRLVVVVASASGTATGSFTRVGNVHRVVAGSGNSAVYFDGGATAIVDINGNTKTVNLTAEAVATLTADWSAITDKVTALATAGKKASFQIVNITFSQSSNITYDPSIGASDPPSTGTNSGSTLLAQSQLVLGCVLFALVLGMFQ
jgi:hypothetical protein